MEQMGEVVQVHAAAFVQRDEQGFLGRADLGNSPFSLDGALAEDRGLGRAPRFLIVVFQRQQERQVGVAAKSRRVGAFGNRSQAGDEAVVGLIDRKSVV